MNKKRVNTSSDAHNEVDLGRLLGSIIDYKWLIIAITSFFTIAGVLYSIFATPIYQANALVQVESSIGSQLVNNLDSLLPDKPQSAAEIELLQSRMVLGKTVEDLHLDISIGQNYFPLFGKGWARLTGEKPGELAISRFNLPNSLLNIPLTLEMDTKNHFKLLNDGNEILVGEVGKLAKNGDVSLLISGVKAEPGTDFTLVKYPSLQVINRIKKNLLIEDSGKDTGVLNVTYTGPDPDDIRKTLDGVTQNYLLQNVERKSAEAEKSLEFLKVQVPKVRGELDAAESKLNIFRQENDSVDLSLEAKSMLDTMVSIETQLNQLTFREAEISKLYTKEHPAYRTLIEKRQTLEDEKEKLNKRISNLPRTQQEIVRLTRDVESGQQVYMQLLNKQQELNISKASTVGNVRIVDSAVTLPGIVQPQKIIIILASVLLGLIVSILVVIIRTIMHRGIENPAELEEAGVNVYASVPLSEWQQKKDRADLAVSKHRKRRANELLTQSNPTDLAVEALRSLRTSLHFAMLEAKNNILMISGASPSIGKTFVSTNLSVLVAQTDKKVLFIDADLRKGYVHQLLGLDNKIGLAEVLSNQAEIEQSVQKTEIENFDVVTRGQVPPNPSELLMTSRYTELLEWASRHYDLVIIDTPPILAVTDAAIIGRHVGTSLMVARYGVNTLKEVELSITRFEQNGIDIKGVILNSVFKKAANYYSSYGYYEYEYKSEK
ncbi:tyrosine protein kinase [[Pantoea] beijingensis]|uniref:Tyrosine protein kinase n=1 Tax=[Pantoea] beijingensis TaxID=1324864 RepID=A0A443IB04_9GAMM|nr:tyrosine-protein kinase Wzc [[Pantoea] beijingensis]RWR01185.1 tyrosine protein kinase [[Pantoea] beijingensis]